MKNEALDTMLTIRQLLLCFGTPRYVLGLGPSAPHTTRQHPPTLSNTFAPPSRHAREASEVPSTFDLRRREIRRSKPLGSSTFAAQRSEVEAPCAFALPRAKLKARSPFDLRPSSREKRKSKPIRPSNFVAGRKRGGGAVREALFDLQASSREVGDRKPSPLEST